MTVGVATLFLQWNVPEFRAVLEVSLQWAKTRDKEVYLVPKHGMFSFWITVLKWICDILQEHSTKLVQQWISPFQ